METTKRNLNLFISYQHYPDYRYLKELREKLSGTVFRKKIKDYGFKDQDLKEMSKYGISRKIQYRIWSASVTIVLVGETTGQSKWVDWEIWYSLREITANTISRRKFYPKVLIALFLPVTSHSVPQRLQENLDSGYASRIDWKDIDTQLEKVIASAIKSRHSTGRKKLIRNDKKLEVNPQWLGQLQYYYYWLQKYFRR